MSDKIKFKVNGIEYSVSDEITSDVSLLDYIRNTLDLRGTKYMCREGGCGACIVNASTSSGTSSKAVNSCLVNITSCDGWDITTIEGLGNRRDGYHTLQKTLAQSHGTQCGYCTPGWIMSMNGFIENKTDATMLEIEQAFGSNLCRCTGYRPIIECFKKYGKDAPKELRIMDIENLSLCKGKGKACYKNGCADEDDWCVVRDEELYEGTMKNIKLKDGKAWYKPVTLTEVFEVLQTYSSGSDYMLVAGNTAKGGFPIDQYPSLLIDISGLEELKQCEMDQNLIIGGGVTLTVFLDVLKEHSTTEYFTYLQKVYEHMLLVAHIPVRNIGTIAGNLMIKHTHNSFQSDVFLLLETVGAQVTIMDWHGNKETHTMQNFLTVDMTGKVLYNILLPPLTDAYELVTFKLMPRAQSAHAIVNCGFLYKFKDKTSYVVEEARIAYGALSTNFLRATATEAYLSGKSLFTNETLQAALKVLDGELVVEENPPEPSAEYRRHVAKALFFKGLLTLCPSSIRGSRYESGTVKLHEARGLSESKQTYTTDSSLYPMNQPTTKLESMYQSAGEALYVDDIPAMKHEVYGAFVLSTVALGTIVKIDATDALKLDGVIACYTASDIPGLNSFTPADSMLYGANEELLCSGTVKYYHQPLAIIVAESQVLADRASKLVKVKYSNVTTPVIDIKKAKEDSSRNTLFYSASATSTGTDVHKVITGENTFHGQYHFSMETMVAVAKPTEEGIEVHSSTQWLDGTHVMISRALGIDQNRIDVVLRRVGGSYGLKISRSIASAIASSLVCYKLDRPCRFIQPLTTNMKAFGKRMPCVNEYEVAVNSSGVIQYINNTIYEDNGHKINETLTALGADVYYNCYDVSKFNYKSYDTITDTAKNTWCRAPGTVEAIAACEYVMERISYELSLDPIAVRLANLNTEKYSEMSEVYEKLNTDAEYVTRRAAVDSFNTQNRWKKRGLRYAFARWAPAGAQRFDINLSVFHGDGTIVITHAGVEMGQGLNTKVAQVAAYLLKVPLSKIQVKTNTSTIAPNSFISGGSLTTQNIIIGLKRCCEQLLTRLEATKATLTDPTWEELVKAAYNNDVDLQAHGFVCTTDVQEYSVYGACLTEVEIDVLTGEYQILRVDLLQDVGISVSPDIDIGQVEGGFMMLAGYWTCEKLDYDQTTGKILTDRTWDYHLPEIRDIPQVFNVELRQSSSNTTILGCKGTGEPSACAAISVAFAIREAITMSRQEFGIPTTTWFSVDGPFSTEAVSMNACPNTDDFKFY